MRNLCPLRILIVFCLCCLSKLVLAQSTSPVMEYSSILTSLDVYHQDGRLQLEDDNAALAAAFLPADATVDVVIAKAGSNQPLHIQALSVLPQHKVFSRIVLRGNNREFKFTMPGDYVATYRANGKPMTVVPFSIEVEKNGDLFDPKTHVYANGPWSEFAYLFASVNAGQDANPQIRFWVRKKSFLPNPPADRYTVELRKNGDTIAVSSGSSSNSKKWQFMHESLMHPESKGGQALKLGELADGQYVVLIKRNNDSHAAYQFKVRGGKPMWHPRQASDYMPRTQYIVPRFPGILGTHGDDSAGNMFWMERLSDKDAMAAAQTAASPETNVSDEEKAQWEWLPRSIDPDRPFKLSITDIQTRNDTAIAAGEDLIVFGTGFPNGVKYMKVGDSMPREIPGGETYSSKVFGVCGTKIALTKKSQVVIFDTTTGELTSIPETVISLYNPNSNSFVTNGFLIATANRATAVADRTIVKVIDVSGSQPKVIPIKNATYVDSDVSSISLDAKRGTIAISSRQKKLIAAAKIAPHANQHTFDLTDYRGVGPQRVFIEGDWITYADTDWKVRLLDLEKGTPVAITDQPFPRAGNGFYVRKGRLAVATTQEKVGSRYRFAVGDLADSPTNVPGTGTEIAGTSGGLGMAGCAAIAVDKTVFLAGTPGDSIGVGEYLQMLDSEHDKWIPLVDAEGQPISASDVTTSMGLLAFKSLTEAGKTVIGYATYGQRIKFPKSNPASANTQAPAHMKSNGPVKPVVFEHDNIYATKDEIDEAYLNSLLESESTMVTALTQALGDEKGKKQVIDTLKMSFDAADKENLIDQWKIRSSLFSEAEKPKPLSPVASDADPSSVEAALAGQWRPLRFVALGQDMPDEHLEVVRLTFAEGKYVLIMGGNVETGTYTIDTSVAPHRIRINIGTGKNQGQVRNGSFKLLEDDQLLAVYATNETDQPVKFTSTPANQQILAGYVRVK